MKMAKRLISVVLVVLMLLSMSVVAASAYTVPDGFEVTDKEATEINGQVYGRIGDADMSDVVNVRDATLIQKSAADLAVLDDVQKVLADTNFDGKVNVKDATAIQKWVADLETLEPINQIIYIPAPTEPETTAPGTEPTETEPTETEVTEPETTEPEATEPEATTPDETEPTEPEATEPEATTPDETEPTEPETTEPEVTEPEVTEPEATEPEANIITVYFTNNKGWENVYIYGFYGVEGGTATGEPLGAYPGTKMTFVEKNDFGQDIYSAEVPADIDYIKFADGTTANNRTNNIPKDEIADNKGFYITDSLGGTKWGYGTYDYLPEEPETTAPEVTEPEVTEPETTLPETSEDEPTEPEVTTPDETVPTEPETTEPEVNTITIYFSNNKGWENVYIYGFYGVEGGTATGEPLGAYPGTKMTFVEKNGLGQDIYSAEVPADIDYIKFADGTTANNRTNNIPKDEIADNKGFYITDSLGGTKWGYGAYDYAPTEPDTTAPEVTEPEVTEPEATTPDETVPTEPETTAPTVSEPDYEAVTVYFTNNWMFLTQNIYWWGSDAENPEWPGVAMTKVDTNEAGQDIYAAKVPFDAAGIIFNGKNDQNPDELRQTVDIVSFSDGEGFYCDKTNDEGKIEVGRYTYEPDVPTEPETTVPEATEPEATEPETTEPEATEPESTEPETTAPTEPEATEPKPTEPAGVTVYAVNSAKWDAVCAYYWGGIDTAWPGTAMTKTGDTVNGFDVYSITLDKAPENIIFNNNNNGSQTSDLTFQAGKYYDIKGQAWYNSLDEIPEVSKLSTDRYLVGSFNGWNTTANEFTISAEGETVAYVELELEANTTYEFKIVREGKWTSCKTTLNITDSAEGLTFSSSVSGNTMLVTKAAGTYVFAFGLETSQLSVTYPK